RFVMRESAESQPPEALDASELVGQLKRLDERLRMLESRVTSVETQNVSKKPANDREERESSTGSTDESMPLGTALSPHTNLPIGYVTEQSGASHAEVDKFRLLPTIGRDVAETYNLTNEQLEALNGSLKSAYEELSIAEFQFATVTKRDGKC